MSKDLANLQARIQSAVMAETDLSLPGLEIYRNAYRQRLVEALAVDYPMLSRWLGRDRFHELAAGYLTTHPSRHFSIRWIGRHLPEFLQRTGPLEWAEMAAFEWSLSLAFDCTDAEPIGPDTLAAIPPQDWPHLSFVLAPGLSLLTLRTSVPKVWKALQDQVSPPDCTDQPEPVSWMVWRHRLRCFFRSMDGPEAHTLRLIKSGTAFAEVCADLAGQDLSTDAAHQVAQWLHRWVEEGLVVGIE